VSEAYDPGEHTVEEVKTYIEEHRDEVADVLAAEQDGKARVTLVEWLEQESGDAIDESPADAEGNRPEGERTDPNTYPDPDNPSHTP